MKRFGTAVILCGGKSRRMGFDKCKLQIKDRLLVEVIGERLEEVFDEVILLSNDRMKFPSIKYRVFEDLIPDSGPLGGVYSALKYASSENVFVTACDMPVIDIDYINYMMELIEDKNVQGVVSCKSKYIEPLYAFYSKSMIGRIEAQIKKQEYKMLEVIKACNIYRVEESEVRKYSSNLDIFTNLNYEADLPILNKIFLEEKSL